MQPLPHCFRGAAAALIAILSLAAVRPAWAGDVSLTPSKDNTLYQTTDGSLSDGAGLHLFAGANGDGGIDRGLVRFDIAGAIPAGSTILSVSLHMHLSRTPPNGAQTIELHRVLADWGEGTSLADGEEGGGAASTTGDATWLHRFYPDTLWTTAGGDFAATVTASVSVNGIGDYTWATSAPMIAEVQGWLDHPESNFGWLLKGNEAAAMTVKRFDSRQSPTGRPTLTIVYAANVDCNTNGTADELDLLNGAAGDCNTDQTPDACQTDTDGDGVIDACDGCPNEPSKTAPDAETGCDAPKKPAANAACGAGLCGAGLTPLLALSSLLLVRRRKSRRD